MRKEFVAIAPNQETADPQTLHLADHLQHGVVKTALGLGLLGGVIAGSRRAEAVQTRITAFFSTDPGGGAVVIPGSGDIKVLNYALALEDLEADLYRQALARLTSGGTSGLGTVIPGLGVASGDGLTYVTRFRTIEQDHATFLRTAIVNAGGPVIPVFAYDFGIHTMTEKQVLQLVYTAELTGVSAYEGAIPFFASKTYLPVAAGILGTEARHTAVLAAVLNLQYAQTPAVSTAPLYTENQGRDTPLTPDQILYQGGEVSPSLTIPPGGHVNPVSGPAGFIYTTS
jgi:hypothetical protein